ncbi:Dps family protein [Amycolatopsis saalfeldensis]|uniref:Starvation-inducible DNA-binding protein n=1 Tax=Amycolatopsis saalfeldensis TaxID=394193 RepID=A0A1H8YLP9_9PSEU|nr:DNA starvation/stationary phase protection protein [Amycolatopsis saalfeldensis]SEP53076.1 starvation-inducible DNA-binding protein [Amycolatopsis saalfeldensis]
MTKTQTATTGFVASAALSTALQQVLVDLIALQLQAKNAHWNVTGAGFRSVHLLLDEVVDTVSGFADDVAERMRALHATPDGRPGTVDASRQIGDLPAGEQRVPTVLTTMTELVVNAVEGVRTVHDAVDAEDPTTADLLHAVIQGLEEKAWMLRSENADH